MPRTTDPILDQPAPELGFARLDVFPVLVCKLCLYALSPKKAINHMCRIHKRPKALKNTFKVWLQAITKKGILLQDPASLTLPSEPILKQPLLKQPVRIYNCRVDPNCNYQSRSPKATRQHLSKSHRAATRDASGNHVRPWEQNCLVWQSAQTLLPDKAGSGKWFEVTSSTPSAHTVGSNGCTVPRSTAAGTVNATLNQFRDFVKAFKGEPNTVNQHEHIAETTPWEQRSGYRAFLKGLKFQDIKATVSTTFDLDQDGEFELKVGCYCLHYILGGIMEKCSTHLGNKARKLLPLDGQLLVSNQAGVLNQRPMRRLEKDSAVQYFGFMKGFLCYIYRIMAFQKLGTEQRPMFSVTEHQRSLFREFDRALYALSNSLERGDIKPQIRDGFRYTAASGLVLEQGNHKLFAPVQVYLLELLASFIGQPIEEDPFESPFLSYLAASSVRGQGDFAPAAQFSTNLSKLVYCIQLISAGYLWLHEQQMSFRKALKDWHGQWLVNTSVGPMGEILNQRLYSLHIAQTEAALPTTRWSPDNRSLTYKTLTISLDDVTKLLQAQLTKATQTLHTDLLFGFNPPTIDLNGIQRLNDDWDNRSDRYSFVDESTNEWLKEMDNWLLTSLMRINPGFLADEVNWKSFETAVQLFLSHLALLVQLGAGQPGRGTEVLGTQMVNNQTTLRNIFSYWNMVMLAMPYHKAQAITNKQRYICRFLPPPVAQLLVEFLILVQPFRLFLQAQKHKGNVAAVRDLPLSRWLWATEDHIWTTSKLSRVLAHECYLLRIAPLTVASWRQIAVSIANQHFKSSSLQMDYGNNEDDQYEGTIEDEVWAQMSSHTSHVAGLHYDRRFEIGQGIDDLKLKLQLNACVRWYTFFGLGKTVPYTYNTGQDCSGKKHKRDESFANSYGAFNRAERDPAIYKVTWSLEQARSALFKLYGTKEFRSDKQRQAVETVLAGHPMVVIILPTGGGKSILFELPVLLKGSHTTIVVVPLVALRQNLVLGATEKRLDFTVWEAAGSTKSTRKRLMFVSVENAVKENFLSFLERLAGDHLLDRIIIDESHLTLTDSDYRPDLILLRALRSPKVQFICLTATLPPTKQEEFNNAYFLVKPTIVRAETTRHNLSYNVITIEDNDLIGILSKAIDDSAYSIPNNSLLKQGIIYVRSTASAEYLANQLDCLCYHARLPDKELNLSQFLKFATTGEPNHRFIVATKALGYGFDNPNVRHIVFCLFEPDSVSLLAQGAGRACRNGKDLGTVTVIVNGDWRRCTDFERGVRDERYYLDNFIDTEGCRKAVLSQFMDGLTVTCQSGRANPVYCDNCWLEQSTKLNRANWEKGHEQTLPVHPSFIEGCYDRPARSRNPTVSLQAAESTTSSSVINTGYNHGLKFQRDVDFNAAHSLTVYMKVLNKLQSTCSWCALGSIECGDWTGHTFNICPSRGSVIRDFTQLKQAGGGDPRKWMEPFAACYKCYQPTEICGKLANTSCSGKYSDIMLCFLVAGWRTISWRTVYLPALMKWNRHEDISASEYIKWCGKKIRWHNGIEASNSCLVAGDILRRLYIGELIA